MSPIAAIPGLVDAVPPKLRAMALYVVATLCFVTMHAIIRGLSKEGIHPFEIAFFRNFFGFCVFLPWLARNGARSLLTVRFGTHFGRAVVNAASMLCWFTALSLLPLADATALSLLGPLFVMAGAVLVFAEPMRRNRWIALAVGAAGALVIIRPGLQAVNVGALLVILTVVLAGSSKLIQKSLLRTDSPGAVVAYVTLLMSPMTLVPALFVWTWPSLGQLAVLAAGGIVGSIAHYLTARAISLADLTVLEPLIFFRLIWAAAIGYLAFAEVPDAFTWLGGALIVLATTYNAHRESRAGRRVAP